MTSPRVLVVNTGSSSLKYQLIEPGTGVCVARGLVERIGEGSDVPDHAAALDRMLRTLAGEPDGLDAT